MALWRTQRGSRKRSRVFSDQDMAPKRRCPWLRYGSTGLIRGEPSFRTVASKATRVCSRRLCPSSAISGAAASRSCQLTRSRLLLRAEIAAHTLRLTRRLATCGGNTACMIFAPPERHLLRAKDLADARYSEPLGVDELAQCAGLSRAHFSREFRRAFGESPHAYLLTRRLERAAALLRTTDRSVADICVEVGLTSVGSFTTSFTRAYGLPPTGYRASFPPAATSALIPACVLHAYGRPQHRTFREDAKLVRT